MTSKDPGMISKLLSSVLYSLRVIYRYLMILAEAGVSHPECLMENPHNGFRVNRRSEGKRGIRGDVTRERPRVGDVMRVGGV